MCCLLRYSLVYRPIVIHLTTVFRCFTLTFFTYGTYVSFLYTVFLNFEVATVL